jgi:hypothetical protein
MRVNRRSALRNIFPLLLLGAAATVSAAVVSRQDATPVVNAATTAEVAAAPAPDMDAAPLKLQDEPNFQR